MHSPALFWLNSLRYVRLMQFKSKYQKENSESKQGQQIDANRKVAV